MDCEVCLQALPEQTGRGRRRQYHEPCKAFKDGLALLRWGVENLPALSPEAARSLAAEVQLVRNSVRAFVDVDARTKYGRTLRAKRQLLGLTPAELAEAAGLKPRQISHYELGHRKPPKDVALALAGALRGFSQSKKKANEVAGVRA
ncbi:hypothetical protein LCGC14_0784400 [marine sediment metagenome]|uniref:HTH cro/C1-type domain-containing protein n=1 Tax=marine sediment metagenome TaxID=412755 RepID=A0A0F9SEF2_9ZZZZ|nr:helix-turn-helix domain-containing protein [Phycisphaerae bacterium]